MKKTLIFLILLSTIACAQLTRIPFTRNQDDYMKTVFVDKTTSQTITGQKNFSGTVKFRSDTSITMGGLVGSYALGLDFYLKTANSYQVPLRFNVLDANTPAWTITSGEQDFTPSVSGKDHVFNIGHNWSSTHSRPQFGQQMEANYEENDTTTWYEWFSYFNDYPSPSTVYNVRPFQIATVKYGSSEPYRYTSSLVLNLDAFYLLNEIGTNLIEFRTQTYGARTTKTGGDGGGSLGNSMMYILDSLYILHEINNFGWLYQRDTSGSVVEIARVDNYNNVQLGKDYAEAVRFSAPTLFDSKSAPDRMGNQVALYNDAGVLKAIDGLGNTKILTGKTIIPQDTAGLDADDLYADPKTAIVKIVLGENLITNGDFTNWTGSGKSATPDNWEFVDPRDTTKYYVEQNPTGRLHYYADGFSSTANLTSTSTGVLGEVYRYSFNVVDLSSDSALIYVCGNGFYVTSAGHYSGEFENVDAGGDLFSIVAYNTNPRGATDITIDNVKVWKSSGGNLVPPEYDVPTILDSLGVLISGVGSTSTGNPDSLGGQPASAYLLKSDSTIYLTPSDANSAYATKSHTHTEFFDTLSISFGVMDTVTTGDYVGRKIENNITITEVSAYTNTGTVTFNIEERGETTPNTAGTDVMTSDLVADTDQQETTTFSNSGIARDSWLVLNVTSKTGDPTIFGVTIRYVKAN